MNLQKQSNRKLRISYAIVFIFLLGLEVFIALFIHDTFIRPYVGDVLVVLLLYTAVRIVIPNKCRLLPLYIFIFSTMVEVSQYFNIVQKLGLEDNEFFRILMGSVFDIKDIICYGVGCILLGFYEMRIKK